MSVKRRISEILAGWIANLDAAEVPDAARIAAKDTVIDTVALGTAALETNYGTAVREAFAAEGGCVVWGVEGRFDPTSAAVINGTCAHGEDCDNTFEGCPVHSGVVIVPALFSADAALGLSVRDVGKGVVVGIDVANRLGVVSGKGVQSAGFHPIAILGTMGAAAGVAAAMSQTPQQITGTLARALCRVRAVDRARLRPGPLYRSGNVGRRRTGAADPAAPARGLHRSPAHPRGPGAHLGRGVGGCATGRMQPGDAGRCVAGWDPRA